MSNKASVRLRRHSSRPVRSALKLVPLAVTLATPALLATPAWATTDPGATTTVAPSIPSPTGTSSITATAAVADPTATTPTSGTTAVADPTVTSPPATGTTAVADPTVTSPPATGTTAVADPTVTSPPTTGTTAGAGPTAPTVPTDSDGPTTGPPSTSISPSSTATPTTGDASSPTAGLTTTVPSSGTTTAPTIARRPSPSTTAPVPAKPPTPHHVSAPSPTSAASAVPATDKAKAPRQVAWATPTGDTDSGSGSGSGSGSDKATHVASSGHSGVSRSAAPAAAPVDGYWVVTGNGGVFTHGNLGFYGSGSTASPGADTVALVPTTDAKGYWMVGSSGQVQAYGDAIQLGSAKPGWLDSPVRALLPTADGLGYWLVTATGGVFSFGDAVFHGAVSQPVKDIAAAAVTPDGGGYLLFGADGRVFTFGDAHSYGEGDAGQLLSPVTGVALTADGGGYWMATANGGVFSFGDARFYGSQPSSGSDPVVSITPTADTLGYWIATLSGKVTAYGDAKVQPNPVNDPYTASVIGLFVPRTGPLLDVPVAYVAVDHQAAATCPGMPWTVLAAVGKVESDFGRSTLPGVTSGANYAGAAGPMQLGVGGAAGPTFYAYDQPVLADQAPNPPEGATPPSPYNLPDAVFAAARDLCASGAASPATLRQAVLSYNHSNSYADEVLSLSSMYGGNPADGSAVVRQAMTQLGVPYLWGGTTPNVGLDCSGLVQWAYRSVGVDLPRTSQEQWLAVAHLPGSAPLMPGDLLFFGPASGPTHVGIYVGGGLMIDAPHTGAVVRIEPYDWSDYLGAGRP